MGAEVVGDLLPERGDDPALSLGPQFRGPGLPLQRALTSLATLIDEAKVAGELTTDIDWRSS